MSDGTLTTFQFFTKCLIFVGSYDKSYRNESFTFQIDFLESNFQILSRKFARKKTFRMILVSDGNATDFPVEIFNKKI